MYRLPQVMEKITQKRLKSLKKNMKKELNN